MTINNRHIIYIVISIVIFLIGVIVYQNLKLRKVNTEYDELKMELQNPIVERDTVVQIDTITIEKPIPKYTARTDERIDTVVEYVYDKDTLYVPINLPIISKEYSNEHYRAVVKGAEIGEYPSLESLEMFQMNKTITETKTIVRKQKWGFNLQGGVGVGYNPWSNKIEPMVGITIGYGLRF